VTNFRCAILGIAVRADKHRQEIGHRLLDLLLKIATSQGIEHISLSVEVDNPALKHGFEPLQENMGDMVMVARRYHQVF
jgi:ribosomal protein S18 acetylase RimI-like enzyme